MDTKIACSHNALNFLLFSYFGITLKDVRDSSKLIDVAIKKAYSDATIQGAYNAMFAKGMSEAKKASEDAQSDCIKYIKDALKELSNIHNPKDFNEWHHTICQNIIDIYADKLNSEKETFFSYGNAQKWVNMTLKYLYLMCGVLSEYEPGINEFMINIGDTIVRIAPHLHVPVDSYILEGLWETDVVLPLREGKNRNKDYSSEKVVPWSQWDETQYKEFHKTLQQYVKDKVPLIWENETWITVAQNRKEKKRKKQKERKLKYGK